MPAKVIPDSVVLRMHREGLTPTQISRRLWVEEHVSVLPEAIIMWARRRGLSFGVRTRHADLLPWIVAPEHADLYAPKMLRLEANRRGGKALSPGSAAKLDRWLDRLRASDHVVHYQRDVEPHWLYVPRRHGVDRDLIREPDGA